MCTKQPFCEADDVPGASYKIDYSIMATNVTSFLPRDF